MGDLTYDLSETKNIVEEEPLTKEKILQFVSEEMIFEHYGVPIKKGLFCSKLRQDRRPTVGLYRNRRGRLIIKDFGSNFSGDCFTYVMALFNVSYYMALQIIANDFGIINRTDLSKNPPKLKYTGNTIEEKKTAKIQIQTREFNQIELNWWLRYGISKETLSKFKVYPVDAIWLNDNLFFQNLSHRYVFGYYGGVKDDIEQWRIYWPGNTKYKFISNWKSTKIQGAHMIPKQGGDYLIVTKSLKDVMCLYEFGIPAIAPCSENLFLTDNQYKLLKSKFKQIALLYDNDIPGLEAAKRIKKNYPDVKIMIIPRHLAKDISDFRKAFGYKKTLELINKTKEYYGKTY